MTVYEATATRWVNTSATAHSVTSGADPLGPLFDAALASREPFELTFLTVGEHRYYCRDHAAAGMTGVVTVVAAPPPVGSHPVGSEY